MEQRQRFIAAADAALRVRRNILLLAAHASGHKRWPHTESCEECKERWPCTTVLRAAGPSLSAVADLPSVAAVPALVAEVRRLREGIEALADDLWRVSPCGCGHRADLHAMGHYGDPGVCTGGLGLCGCDWTFTRIAQERLRALLQQGGEHLVRAHPVRGGRPLVTDRDHLREEYTEVEQP